MGVAGVGGVRFAVGPERGRVDVVAPGLSGLRAAGRGSGGGASFGLGSSMLAAASG